MDVTASIEHTALRLLSDLDPYGLMPGRTGGTPADEYAPEARSIATCLETNGRITVSQVDAVWSEWFGEPLSGRVQKARVAQLVDDLKRAVTVDRTR